MAKKTKRTKPVKKSKKTRRAQKKRARPTARKTAARGTSTRKAAARKTAAKKVLAKKATARRTVGKTALAPSALAPAASPVAARAAGFDTGSYPGDAAITAWATHSPYAFVGFYFDAPCHTTASFKSWSGKSAFVKSTGLGLAVVYVGFQQDGCGKNNLSRANGIAHGNDTIAKFAAEGFAPGTIVFLDVEAFNGAISANMQDYVRGWLSALLDDGSVSPGIYCPAAKANALRLTAAQEYAGHGQPGGAPAFWIVKVGNPGFDPATSSPTGSGVPFANVWQGVIDSSEEHGGVTLAIDRNVADSRNPSNA
jgi:hypothetical protein